MCLLFFLKLGSTGYSLGIVQWDFTRRDHPGNPGRVFGSGPVKKPLIFQIFPPTPPPFYKPLIPFIFKSHFNLPVSEKTLSLSSLLSLRSENGEDKRSSLFLAVGALGPHSPCRQPLYSRLLCCRRPLNRRPLCRCSKRQP